MTQAKIPVGILGATGAVGQKFVLQLAQHPWFQIAALAASERSAGLPYEEAAAWKQSVPMPDAVRKMIVQTCEPSLGCRIVFSGLDSSVAGEVEQAFASRGCWIFSNAKNHRMDPDVPLVITEINPDHLDIIPQQQKRRNWNGAIVTNANCASIVLAMSLWPLHRKFGVELVHTVTFQAVSGAGYPGVPSLDILGNVVPYIPGEEAKLESESQKILGRLRRGRFQPAPFTISAHANRVAVEEGHMMCVSVKLRRQTTPEKAALCLTQFESPREVSRLPSAPPRMVVVLNEADRPQPRLDVWKYNGMACLVGRIRECPLLDLKYVALGHNTIRGAAGASVLNAELAVARGLVR